MAKAFVQHGYEVKAVANDFLNQKLSEADDKKKELEFFCKMLNHKDKDKVSKWIHNNVDITSRGDKDVDLMNKIMKFLITFDKHKVDGKIWSNGCFGSRWSDKVDGCRIAFYSRKLDKEMFKNCPPFLTKEYLIIIMITD
jgi:succinate dehydrogenase flavin-adding protein (antitoxin of CptAB toxin-antitoxin module)